MTQPLRPREPQAPLVESVDFRNGLDRRVFLRGVGHVSVGLLLANLGGCESLRQQIENRPTRRRIHSGVGSAAVQADLDVYRAAVEAMKALPASNPRSWAAQAAIHGTGSMFNHCQHGTPHFFSWHRAYLLFFEQICRELAGVADWALPYWNWNQNQDLDAKFTASGSALNHSRVRTSTSGFSSVGDAELNTILSDGNFFTFSSQLEGTPHNSVHGIIGNTMATGGSPLDPIFWAHHNMVDYCWAKWNIELDNDNPSDETWNNTSWDHFTDGSGNPVESSAGITVLMPLLSYRFESSTIGSNTATARAMDVATTDFRAVKQRLEKGADVELDIRMRVPIAQAAMVRTNQTVHRQTRLTAEQINAVLTSDGGRERVFASIGFASLPTTNDYFVRVFVNLPTADQNTAIDDRHYAGSFSFFGTRGAHTGHQGRQPKFLVNVTDAIQRLRNSGELKSDTPISVQLVAVPLGEQLAEPEATLHLDTIEFLVSPVTLRLR